MNLQLFIAKRYLLKKRTFNLINIISIISIVSIAVGTMSLIIILSVFNGFESIISNLFVKFNPEIQITAKQGKVFVPNDKMINQIKSLKDINNISYVIQDNALLKYNNKQVIATIKGVDNNYTQKEGINDVIIDGQFILNKGKANYAVIGQTLAYHLNIDVYNYHKPITIYAPSRKKEFNVSNFNSAFNNVNILPVGIFAIQQDFDAKYIYVPINVAKQLFDYQNQISTIEIFAENKNVETLKKQIQQIVGEQFYVKDRYQQQEMLYKIMNSEKWAVTMILILILFIASFNLVGSITTIIIDKKQDIFIYKSLGMSQDKIKKIFIYNSFLISFIGLSIGLIIGYSVCFIQMKFGIIGFQTVGNFIISAYPVKVKLVDTLLVILPVTIIALISAYLPAKIFVSKIYKDSK